MDKSKLYILMCKEAKKIQENWKPKEWDYIYDKIDRKIKVLSGYETDAGYYGPSIEYFNQNEYIFIPRQDQLQQLLNGNENHKIHKFLKFHYKFERDMELVRKKYSCCFLTIERLWLALVMKEKYNKIWNGGGQEKGKWVKNKK